MDVAEFKKLPILGILRGIDCGIIAPLVETIISSGLKTIEITMNTKAAAELIKSAIKISKSRLTVGAGTVLNMNDLKSALSAGATFIVMPALIPDVLEYCAKKKIPVFPGALTPQEVYNAWNNGATMVKVFPAKLFGPDYFRELKGPFNEIELLACAGVTPQNLKVYFSCGASAVAFGASVFKKEQLLKRDFSNIEQGIKGYLRSFQAI